MKTEASARRRLLPLVFSIVLLSGAAFDTAAQGTNGNEKLPPAGLRLQEVLDRGPAQSGEAAPAHELVPLAKD